MVADTAPEMASFTFGCPSAETLARLRKRGVLTAVTVTSLDEAGIAVGAGADALVVQGPRPAVTAARSIPGGDRGGAAGLAAVGDRLSP